MLQPNEIYLNGNNSTVQIATAHETSKTFSYNGNEVLFDIKDDVMVNATQLAKIYGKRPNDYLSLPATNQLINAITRKYGISENQLVISKAGSSHNGGGTWMHRLIVVDFCQWLDIDLKLWCTEKLDELMRYGMTATQPTLEQMINNPDLVISLATQLKSEREEKQRLALEVQKKEQEKQSIIEETVDKAFKKILFSFGSLRNCCTFAVLTVRQTLLLRRAAVNCSMVIGHFLCLILNDIRRLSIRSHCFVLRGKVCWTVSSVYGNRFSVVYNDLNAYSHE
jgi:hypothetical protein